MDPATVNALIQLVSFGLQTFQSYQQGNITADQATQMLQQASTNLQNAIAEFEAAGGTKP